MRFYRLLDDVQIPERWHLGTVRSDLGDTPPLRTAVPCVRTALSSDVRAGHRALDFSLTSLAVPVLSRSLAETIRNECRNDAEFLPLEIPGHEGFVVLNVLRVEPCIDEARSEFLKWTTRDHRPELAGSYRQVTDLRLDRSRIPSDAQVFRLEGWEIALIVSEKVKDLMMSVNCVGASFHDVC
ncbi:MAG: hypothetical protein R3F20_14700 [Planctomycetota bacterium]